MKHDFYNFEVILKGNETNFYELLLNWYKKNVFNRNFDANGICLLLFSADSQGIIIAAVRFTPPA